MYSLMHYIYIDALHLHWCTTSTLMRYIYIDVLHLHWCTTSTLMHYFYIDALHLHWCIIFILMRYIYIDALLLHWCITSTLMHYIYIDALLLQPVPDRMRLEMVIGMEMEILDFQSSCLFSYEPFEKRPAMTIEDLHFPFDDHFECHLFGNGLYREYNDWSITFTARNTNCLYQRLVELATLTEDNDSTRKTMIQWCVHCMQRFITFTISYLNWFVTFSKNTMIDSLHATIDSLHSPQHILMGLLHPLWIQWCMRSVYHIYTNGLQEQLTELETLAEDND